MWWLGAVRQQAITWVNVGQDLCRHMPSLRHNEPLLWRHNGGKCFSNHLPHDCLLNRLFGRRSKKTSKLRVTGLCAGNSPETGEFPHKWPVTVTREMFPFDILNSNAKQLLGTSELYEMPLYGQFGQARKSAQNFRKTGGLVQGSFCVCAQPMRDGVTVWGGRAAVPPWPGPYAT